jgi:ubiquinone/menaquinone biosynthesis C-methylase UbiE
MNAYNRQYNKKRLQESQQYWDDLAPTFDNEPDHGLREPLVRATWTEFLKTWLPQTNAAILDIGCGTGSFINVSNQNLSGNPNFWGGSVSDERYAIIADHNK